MPRKWIPPPRRFCKSVSMFSRIRREQCGNSLMPKPTLASAPDLREKLVTVLDKFDIKSPVEFSFDGEAAKDVRSFQPAPRWGAAAPGDDLLVKAIQTTLYHRCYTLRVA